MRIVRIREIASFLVRDFRTWRRESAAHLRSRRRVLLGLLPFDLVLTFASCLNRQGLPGTLAWPHGGDPKPSDYEAVSAIFGKPLPDSFRLTWANYPGYSPIWGDRTNFGSASCHAVVKPREWATLLADLPTTDGRSMPYRPFETQSGIGIPNPILIPESYRNMTWIGIDSNNPELLILDICSDLPLYMDCYRSAVRDGATTGIPALAN